MKSHCLLIIGYHITLTGKGIKDYFDCEKIRSNGSNGFGWEELRRELPPKIPLTLNGNLPQTTI
jgi:hypothetical protein